jgi:uncharacterized protein (TIGR02678 family)
MTTPLTTTTATHDAMERQEAARALLRMPVLTARSHPGELALVRRHGSALQGMFLTVLGYRLITESSFARLMKTPVSSDGPVRPAKRASGNEFTARTYTYLALVSAGLLAPDTGEQILLSSLIDQLRSDATTAGLTIDDTLTERRHLIAAINLLIRWGVLEETDGSVSAWGERQEEALLTVNRSLLPHLLAQPLHAVGSPEDLWSVAPEPGEQPRRSLRRKLVENPLVRREDLTDAERDVLSRERTEIARMLEEHFGLTLEVRAEGALCFDSQDELSDVAFPGTGTIRQVGLLMLSEALTRFDPRPGAHVAIGGREVPGLWCPWPEVDAIIAALADQHRGVWSAEYVSDLPRLRAEVVDLLASLSLATVADEGLVIHPAAARYRPDPQRAPAKTPGRVRPDTDSGFSDSPALFDEEMS